MSHHNYTPVNELRASTRFVKERYTDHALIWNEDFPEKIVEVHDESLNGLGIYLPGDACQVGQQFELVYAGKYFHACVRHMQRQDNGESIVGLSCERVADYF